VIRGDDAGQSVWDLMADLYGRTNDKFGPWAARFLPRRFFELAPAFIDGSVRFSAAYEGGAESPMALAMLFQGRDTLWGRYWGSARDLPGLHFETCYYAPIGYAIRESLAGFDPGMGSEHKARRGFRSSLASSYHRVFDPRLHRVFASALAEASAAETRMAGALNEELPFRNASALPRPS
jgi:predicted N-acyltransferase